MTSIGVGAGVAIGADAAGAVLVTAGEAALVPAPSEPPRLMSAAMRMMMKLTCRPALSNQMLGRYH
jgi:hypothetical protein